MVVQVFQQCGMGISMASSLVQRAAQASPHPEQPPFVCGSGCIREIARTIQAAQVSE